MRCSRIFAKSRCLLRELVLLLEFEEVAGGFGVAVRVFLEFEEVAGGLGVAVRVLLFGTRTTSGDGCMRGLILNHEATRFGLRSTRLMNFSTMLAIVFACTVSTIGIGVPSRNSLTAVICKGE